MDKTILTLVASGFILVGVISAGFLLVNIRRARASQRWPKVSGELESDALRRVVYRGTDSNGTADQASALLVDFRYRYSVHGKEYHGHRVSFSDGINKTSGALKQLQQRFRNKPMIRVYYNPADPADSVLVPGVSIYNFTPLITSGLFLAVGIYLLNMDL